MFQNKGVCLILISANGFGELVGAGSTTATLDVFEQICHILRIAANNQSSHPLGVAFAAVIDPAESDDAVVDLKIDGSGAGTPAFVIKHNQSYHGAFRSHPNSFG